jgi:hypothetical protein
MPEPAEKRHSPRCSIKLPFLYRLKTPISVKAGAGWTHNINEEGACLEFPDRLEESSAFQILFQTDHGGLSLGVKVLWVAKIRERGEGLLHGVVFPELNDDKRQVLCEFLQSRE